MTALVLRFFLVVAVILTFDAASRTSFAQGDESLSQDIDFTRDILPMLTDRCLGCHGAEKQESGLRLDSAELVHQGGDSGPVIDTQAPDKSRILLAVLGQDKVVSAMPPEGKPLTKSEVAILRAWITGGAKRPPREHSVAQRKRSDHWSFKVPERIDLPTVRDQGWCTNPIDRMILQQLEQRGIRPSPEADRSTLIRRLSLDLLGTLPAPEEVVQFTADQRPDAYEQLVDRTLASPSYGERWGRHWLDQARYADSNGYTRDFGREIWKYRDWVIEAINRDMPFDQFTIEQIAGDMVPGATRDQIVATGFHRNTLINEEGGTDKEQFRVEAVADRVNTTGSVYLGLTLGCARCHQHKYDPISQREYYQLFAFLNNCNEPTYESPSDQQLADGELARRADIRRQIAALEEKVEAERSRLEASQRAWEKTVTPQMRARLPGPVQVAYDMAFEKRDAANKKLIENYFRDTALAKNEFPLLQQIADLRATEPVIPTTLVMEELTQPRDTFIHLRGNFLDQGARVAAGVPSILHPLRQVRNTQDLPREPKPHNRLDFARWLVDPLNPLTARVIANRCWFHFFGQGIVETDDDFGTQGSLPTHPQLLDFLALEFMGSLPGSSSEPSSASAENRGPNATPWSWSMKHVHRLIVCSTTYRQSSSHRAELQEIDPRNLWLARQTRIRLDAEAVRDAALSGAGLLARIVGGPSVFPPQPDGVFDFTQDPKPWKTAEGADRYRRGMYTHVWRSSPYPALVVFDAPDGNVSCTRRVRSNTPLQALTLANDTAFFECAVGLSRRTWGNSTTSLNERLRQAALICFSRSLSAIEIERVEIMHAQLLSAYQQSPVLAVQVAQSMQSLESDQVSNFAAWLSVCRALLNLDEFITRE